MHTGARSEKETSVHWFRFEIEGEGRASARRDAGRRFRGLKESVQFFLTDVNHLTMYNLVE
jgi:hypothetical protein